VDINLGNFTLTHKNRIILLNPPYFILLSFFGIRAMAIYINLGQFQVRNKTLNLKEKTITLQN
jgi:hypothetical protein